MSRIMKAAIFDKNNLWHKNAHLLFGFSCFVCDGFIGSDDILIGDLEIDFLSLCVVLSDEAQKRGWVCVDEFKFLCPQCAAKKTNTF